MWNDKEPRMRLLVVLALIGIVCGDASPLGYKYPQPKATAPEVKLTAVSPPVTEAKPKSPLPAPPVLEYIPPTEFKPKSPIAAPAPVPATEYIPPTELKANPVIQPVSEIPKSKKLIQEGYNYIAPKSVQPIAPIPEETSAPADVEPAHELTNEGYKYKTVRRIRYRYRS